MKDDKTFNDFTHKLAHAIAGCAVGAAKTGNCSSGALGAVVGELSAEWYGGSRTNNSINQPGFQTDTVNFAKMMAGIAAAITGGDAEAINLAASTGGNAAENNYLNHADNEERLRAASGCDGGNSEDCDIRDMLEARDRDTDAQLLYACRSNPGSAECMGATRDMRTQLATYFESRDGVQLRDSNLSAEEIQTGMDRYSAKSELQSYVDLLSVSNQQFLGDGSQSNLPDKYDSDPYGVMDSKSPALYAVVKVGDQWGVVGKSDGVYTSNAGVNGILNETNYAPGLVGFHLNYETPKADLYTLYYNPTEGFLLDGLETFSDKLGFTTDATKQFSQVLGNVQEGNITSVRLN